MKDSTYIRVKGKPPYDTKQTKDPRYRVINHMFACGTRLTQLHWDGPWPFDPDVWHVDVHYDREVTDQDYKRLS